MNFDSIHRLIEETQVFPWQQPPIKAHCDVPVPASLPQDACRSFLPIHEPETHATQNTSVPSCSTNKWDICEELRLRELEEVKARAAQMEKTMRWWSDCTANWREKWSKVRAERNSAREEGRQLRIKLEMTMKELSALKKKQSQRPQKEAESNAIQDLELPSDLDVSYDHRDHSQRHSDVDESVRKGLMRRQFPEEPNIPSKENCGALYPPKIKEELKSNPNCTDFCKNGGSRSHSGTNELKQQAGHLPLVEGVTETSALQVHLVEFQKILWKEREMRAALEKEIEQLESALSVWKWKYEELKRSKLPNMKACPGNNEHQKEGEKKGTRPRPGRQEDTG